VLHHKPSTSIASYPVGGPQPAFTLLALHAPPSPLQVRVRRASLMDDAYRALSGAGPGLRARLSVTFVNDQGLE
jgi:hypothetical protein